MNWRVTIAGRSANLGPGSVAYVASNEEHGWRNVGTGLRAGIGNQPEAGPDSVAVA